MKKVLLVTFLVVTTMSFAQTDLEKGIEWYNKRAEGSIGTLAKTEPIDSAIRHFKKVLGNSDVDKEAAISLLKCYYYRGKFVSQDDDAKKADFDKGKALAESYIKKYPNNTSIRYWYLVNLGSWSEVYGIFTAAKEGVANIMKEHAEKIIELGPESNDGGGYFMLGAVHFKSPYIPFLLSWPDNDDAIKYLRKAVSIEEATLSQQVYLARALYKDKQKKEALEIVKKVAATIPSQDSLVEDLDEIDDAKELVEDWE